MGGGGGRGAAREEDQSISGRLEVDSRMTSEGRLRDWATGLTISLVWRDTFRRSISGKMTVLSSCGRPGGGRIKVSGRA